MGPIHVLYDEDCGFCRWSAGRLCAWDRRGRLTFAPIQAAGGMLDAIPPFERLDSWHAVTPDGRVWSAGAAVAPVLRVLPGGRPLAALAEAAPDLTDRIYGLAARHRGTLGRALGQTACAVDPRRRDPVPR
jgi:predicted DCC family thiol-disulfide oxidoreductase YuxK